MDVQEYTETKAAADEAAPSGAWAGAPSLAASTVEMQNTSGYPVWVDVVGGTVTVIEVEGETTGLTSRLVPPAEHAVDRSHLQRRTDC